ncbi:MAG: hypothetical protein SGPRY_002654 [Prymnesium sp.]
MYRGEGRKVKRAHGHRAEGVGVGVGEDKGKSRPSEKDKAAAKLLQLAAVSAAASPRELTPEEARCERLCALYRW